jgi:competence protein ComEA
MWRLRKYRPGTAILAILGIAVGGGVNLTDASEATRQRTADQAAFNTVCGACHPASAVNGLRTEPEWRETVEHMISIGAKGTDEQFESVMRVLERTLTKVNVNTATAEEIAPVIDVSNATAQAVVKYRTEHGKFKTVDDLKKVPGLDAAKVETRRDRIML